MIVDKLIRRANGVSERYSGGPATLDLKPWLDENSAVTVQKDIHAQMGFATIDCVDRVERNAGQSLYHMLEPMDHVTIRMARDPHKYGGQPPVMMRGFVVGIHRSEAMSESGVPTRRVTVTVADYTKLFHNVQVFYLPNNPLLAVGFQFLAELVYGARANQYGTPREFVNAALELVNNEFIQRFFTTAVRFITPVIDIVEGVVNPLTWQAYQGTLWNLLLTYADRPWNELFIRDYEEGPRLIYRPAPFYDPYSGQIIPFGADQYSTIEESVEHIESADIVSLTLSRRDDDIANFFWVGMPNFLVLGGDPTLLQDNVQAHDPSVEMTGYQNNDPSLYGPRLLNATTMHGPTGLSGQPVNREDQQHEAYKQASMPWLARKRVWLRDTNKDNVVLEQGQAVVKGNEKLVAGTYCWLNRGIPGRYYVTGVTHQFQPFRTYTTKLAMIRGEGFLQAARTSPSPYWHEHRRGVYG